MFFKFPYTDMYTLNLDWMIKFLKEAEVSLEQWQEIINGLGTIVHSVNGQTGDVNLGTLVNSVNGQTGNVNLGTLVNSVNGKTGAVEIDNDDINALKIEVVLQTTDPASTFTPAVVRPLFNSGIRFIIINNKEFYSITEAGAMIRFNPFEDLNISKELAQPPANQAEIEALYNQGIRFIRYAVSDIIKTYALEKIDSVVVAYDLDGTNGANLFNFIDSNETIADYSTATLRSMYNSGVRILFQDETNGIKKFYALLGTEVDGYTGYTEFDPVSYFDNTFVPSLQSEINTLKSSIDSVFSVDFSENGYINNNGTNSVISTAFRRTDYIPLSNVLFGIEYELCLDSGGNIVSYYDENKTYLGGVAGGGNTTVKSGMLEYPEGAKYVRFSYCVTSAGITNPGPVIRLKDITQYSGVGSNAVKTSSIVDKAVTMDKCSFIIHNPETNYINKSDYSEGYISASGAFVPNAGWRATEFCTLLPETQYFSGGLHGGYCAFYKEDKTVIAAYGANAFTVTNFTTPAETAYARFSLNASSQSVDTAWINIKDEKPEDYGYILNGVGMSSNVDNPCDYDGREISVFNRILCVGDSMTEGTFNHLDSGSTQWINYEKYSYPTYLHKMTGVDVTNLGHGGQTSVQWYNTEQNSDLSGYDCAIIQLGINDFGTYGELGTETKTAFQNIITKLKNENKNIKIFVANIIPATSYSSAGYKAFSTALLEWLKTAYASNPNVIPVDIQQYGHTGNSSAFNAGHLTALGYRMLAQDYIGFISSYIKNNGSVFREVQFIGTDYWYANPNS